MELAEAIEYAQEEGDAAVEARGFAEEYAQRTISLGSVATLRLEEASRDIDSLRREVVDARE